jgi:hypothetical protein
MTKPAYLITPNSISVVFPDADPAVVYSSSPAYLQIADAIKRSDWDSVRDLLNPGAQITKQFNEALGSDAIRVECDQIFYHNKPLHNVVTDRILYLLQDGFDVSPMVRFLERLMNNPSYAAVEELFLFLEASDLPITEDGCFLAYKRIRSDWTDQYTGRVDNSIGTVVEMPRNQVDDDRDRTCSSGLHFCALQYLPHYGAEDGGRVVVVKIDPADVVAIPSDYNNQKGRTCRYEVVRELPLMSRSRTALPEGRLEGDFVDEEDERLIFDDNMIAQIIPLTGEVKEYFDSASHASRVTGIDSSSISKVLRGLRQSAGGYGWVPANMVLPSMSAVAKYEDDADEYTVNINYDEYEHDWDEEDRWGEPW